MRDFKLRLDDDNMVDFVYNETAGDFELTESMRDTVINNIILSISIRKGELVGASNFGSRRFEIATANAASADLLKIYDTEALQWIIDAKRARSIDIATSIDPDNKYRINERIMAVLYDGQEVPFTTFYKVV